jgi:hypothetical protein
MIRIDFQYFGTMCSRGKDIWLHALLLQKNRSLYELVVSSSFFQEYSIGKRYRMNL